MSYVVVAVGLHCFHGCCVAVVIVATVDVVVGSVDAVVAAVDVVVAAVDVVVAAVDVVVVSVVVDAGTLGVVDSRMFGLFVASKSIRSPCCI